MERGNGREWTVRLAGPVRYRRYTASDHLNRPTIFFEFDLPPGEREVPKDVYDVIKSMKYLHRSEDHGGGVRPTGLENRRGTWRFPDTPVGRTAADVLDAKLAALAHRAEKQQGWNR